MPRSAAWRHSGAKRLGHPGNVGAIIAEVGDLDMPGAQHFGRLQQQRTDFIRRRLARVGAIPVQQPFDFDIDDAVGVQDLFHVLEAVLLPDLENIRMPGSPCR